MRTNQMVLRFEVGVVPPPTVPIHSWEEARADYKRGPVVGSPSDVVDYFQHYIGGKHTEAFLVLYLDQRNHVLDVYLASEGTVDQTVVYPREVLKRGLELNATGMILAHNHPAAPYPPPMPTAS